MNSRGDRGTNVVVIHVMSSSEIFFLTRYPMTCIQTQDIRIRTKSQSRWILFLLQLRLGRRLDSVSDRFRVQHRLRVRQLRCPDMRLSSINHLQFERPCQRLPRIVSESIEQPQLTNTCPVIQLADSEKRNMAIPAISSAVMEHYQKRI
jgi:hypothetical protein